MPPLTRDQTLRLFGIDPPMLRAGRIAVIAANYGEVQDAGRGVGRFRGGHAVVVGQPEDGHVTVADPLRRDLVRWRTDLLVRAMESFGRRPWMGGRGEAAVPLPSPTLLARAESQRDAARRERDAARTAEALAKAAADDLRADLTTAEARIKELEAAPDCVSVRAELDATKASAASLHARIEAARAALG